MKKFLDALNGLKIALNHKSVLIQLILGLFAIIGGLIIQLDYYEWLAFIVCISIVVTMEVFNTSIERIGNYLNIEEDYRVKEIKDLSSGAVLISALGALIICVVCVIRRI